MRCELVVLETAAFVAARPCATLLSGWELNCGDVLMWQIEPIANAGDWIATGARGYCVGSACLSSAQGGESRSSPSEVSMITVAMR